MKFQIRIDENWWLGGWSWVFVNLKVSHMSVLEILTEKSFIYFYIAITAIRVH